MNSWQEAVVRFGKTDKDIDILNAALLDAQNVQVKRVVRFLEGVDEWKVARIVELWHFGDDDE